MRLITNAYPGMISGTTRPIALITGGSSGLGYAFATWLGTRGYDIYILARDKSRLRISVEKLSEIQVHATGIACDVTSPVQLQEAAEKISNLSAKVDFLILNAGSVSTKLLTDYADPEELKSDLENDLWGTIQSAYYFVPLLREGSRVLLTSSGFGLMGAAGYSTYCAAKAGIIYFGESLRRELLHRKIQVYVTCPGDMDTPQFAAEIAGQPGWMKAQSSPRKLMSAEKAADKILRNCKGRMRFLIIPSSDVKMLLIASRLLPRKWRDRLLDNMFPRPKSGK